MGLLRVKDDICNRLMYSSIFPSEAPKGLFKEYIPIHAVGKRGAQTFFWGSPLEGLHAYSYIYDTQILFFLVKLKSNPNNIPKNNPMAYCRYTTKNIVIYREPRTGFQRHSLVP